MAEGHQLPWILAGGPGGYRTPQGAIVVMALLGWACALSSRFALLAAVSAIARLLCYMSTCLALPVLRRKMPEARRTFSIAGGATIPAIALVLSAWLLLGSTKTQTTISAAGLLAGAVVLACF